MSELDASPVEFAALPVLVEIAAERSRQNKRWGEQNHPLSDPYIRDREYPDRTPGERWERVARYLCERHEIATEARAKYLCSTAERGGVATWAAILIEEVAEFVAATAVSPTRARAELVQVAAVAVQAIEAIDRGGSK